MKLCTKCGFMRFDSDFSKCSAKPDGLQARCKYCVKLYHKSDTYKQAKKTYDRSIKGLTTSKQYRQSARAKVIKADVARADKASHPEKYIARSALNNAVRDGRMIRPDICSACHTACFPHGHHEDYFKPLDVVWLCQPCHVQTHNQPSGII